jgi:hypothetical protein
MFKHCSAAMVLFLALSLIAALLPIKVTASYGESEKQYYTTQSSAIGTISSWGGIKINGRLVYAPSPVYNGDLLQSPLDTGATLTLNAIGQASLVKGTLVRLSARPANGNTQPVLMASLLKGEMTIKLQPTAVAYIRTGDMEFNASAGTDLRAVVEQNRLTVYDLMGEIQDAAKVGTAKYVVRPVGVGATISVRARSTRQIQIRVTDENDKPVPDLPVLFVLGSNNAGSLSTATATTNAQGIATTSFNAAATPNATSITATVQGTDYSWTGEIEVIKKVGFWTTRNMLLVGASAATAGTITAIAVTREGKKAPITPLTPVIKPSR